MQGTRTRSCLLLVCALALSAPTAARAQEGPADTRLTLVPLIGGGTLGHRWESGETSFGPGAAMFAGGALQLRLTPTLAAEVVGAYAWGSSYSLDFGERPSRGAGDIDLIRATVGALWRMRANVPGYFSVGAGALHYSPKERITFLQETEDGGVTAVPVLSDEAEWMPSAYVGAGIDIASGDHAARFDLRAYASRSGQTVSRFGGGDFSPRLAFDFQFFLGYLIRL